MTSPFTAHVTPGQWSRPEIILIVGSSLAVLAILTIVTSLLIREHGSAKELASRGAANVVQLIDADVLRNAELYDTSLQGMIAAWQRPDLASISPELRQLMLFDRSVAAPYKGDLLVLDANGDVVADSTGVVPRVDNFGSAPVFQQHKNSPSPDMLISAPFKARWGFKDWCISLSRRMSGPDGQFMGIATGAMRLVYFNELFKSLNIGQDSTVNLISSDGIMLARQPEIPGRNMVGEDFSRLPNFQRILKEGDGSFTGTSSVDNKERLYTFSRVGELPLIVVVAQSVDEVYAVWRRNATLVGTATSILCLGILWLTWLLGRQLRLRQRAEFELAELASTDGLTGLANRRKLDQVMKTEWARGLRSGKPLSLLMIDVDHFKAFNDRHGHHAGDEALRKVADSISGHIRRPGDLAARYGGEEFLVVLPETNLHGAQVIAEIIRAGVQALPRFADDKLPITVSIGIASQVINAGDQLPALLRVADRALYLAKDNGRNRVESESLYGEKQNL